MKTNNTGRIAKVTDKAAEWGITVSGILVIAAMIAMFVLIIREAAPLFSSARHSNAGTLNLPSGMAAGSIAAIGVEKDLHDRAKVVWLMTRTGEVGYSTLENGMQTGFIFSKLPAAPDGTEIQAVEVDGTGSCTVLWKNNLLVRYRMAPAFTDSNNTAPVAGLDVSDSIAVELDDDLGLPRFAMIRGTAEKYRAVAVYPNGTVVEKGVKPGKGLLAKKKSTPYTRSAANLSSGKITAAAINNTGETLYLGIDNGTVVSLDLSKTGSSDIPTEVTPVVNDREAVTALSFLNGDYALAVGDMSGRVSVWFPRRENGEFRLRQSAGWGPSVGGVTAIVPSPRDRGFFAMSTGSIIRWFYSTTGRELDRIASSASPLLLSNISARGDSLATLHENGELIIYDMESSYPEAGWAAFFKRLLYEGYESPAYVWQSTGSDASEPKLSLVPLIWGSIKGALYALIFATPIALLAALYLSQFADPRWRAILKPAVEMVAAVPSVVIGFIAALWLAPLLERYLRFFVQHYHYDQRNSLVIAIAMGFAVIPTFFSLAEDAISAVPPSLSSASLALGASKWQTVWRVVLPTASPGIFTAVMLGLGRAVGETMIVLMATGNTPILSLSPFNGMRTLSANIAVEMPEAPVGGTLYRTLFLCALILFVMTLVINMAAEMFRQRLRRRYGRL